MIHLVASKKFPQYYNEANIPVFKVLVVGATGVGKTSLIKKYVDGVFDANLKATIGVDFSLKTMVFEAGTKKKYVLQIWDVAGEQRFFEVLPNYVPGTKATILCFDSINPIESLIALNSWINVIKNASDNSTLFFVLISTKNDLKQFNNPHKIKQFRKEHPEIITYLSTSAKDGTNIENIFHMIGTSLIQRFY